LQDILGHAEQLLLGQVRVHDHAALEPRRRARDVGEPVADEPAGAGLRGGDRQAAGPKPAPDDLLQRLAVTPVAVIAEPRRGGAAADPAVDTTPPARRASAR